MLGSLLNIKKKLSDNQLANVFLNGILDLVDTSFAEIADLINEDAVFVQAPNIDRTDNTEFTMIILVANICSLENTFESVQAVRIEQLIFEKLGVMMQVTASEAESVVREYQKFMARVNSPSKNVLYSISKAIFHKYNLNQFQDEYFRRLQSPNPIFIKRMDKVVEGFLWDWDAFFKKYKLEE
jgi:hypothetical protein